MKLVVLDGYALNPGDNPWDEIAALGELTVWDRTPREKILERGAGAEVLFTNKTPLGEAEFAALPSLKYVGVLATGFNVVDVAAAARRGIPVCNVPTYGTESVAELVFAHILELSRRVGTHAEAVRGGAWSAQPDYSFWLTPQRELAGKTLGVVGLGRIGRRTAEIAHAFGMKVLAYGLNAAQPPFEDGFAWADLDTLLAESDFISLHCPLTAENEKMIGAGALARMKPTACLINTARGQLVDGAALAAALDEGRIAGAALDVLAEEPPAAEDPLLRAKNALVTPHIAWATLEARQRLMHIAAENVSAWLAGRTQNRVN